MRVQYGLSVYGESIVIQERFDNANEYDMRMSMVVMSLVFGLVQLVMLIRSRLQIPCRRLYQLLIFGTVLFQTFHFADNIFMPAKHHEPAWLYQRLLLANMDKTFLYQFVFLLALSLALRLLSTSLLVVAPPPSAAAASTTTSSESDKQLLAIALRNKQRRMSGWLWLLVFGGAQLLTAGHLLVDPLEAYAFDAAVSIVVQSAFGLALVIAAVSGLFMCYATPLEIQQLEAIESGKKG